MRRVHIPLKLYNEIKEYCILNEISEINKTISSMLEKGFNITKYGNSPFKFKEQNTKIEEKDVQKKELFNNIEQKENTEQINENKVNVKTEIIKKPNKKINKGITIIKN